LAKMLQIDSTDFDTTSANVSVKVELAKEFDFDEEFNVNPIFGDRSYIFKPFYSCRAKKVI